MKAQKLIISCLLVVAVAVIGAVTLPTLAQATIVDSGACGATVSWMLDDSGVLTIYGSGSMADYFDAGSTQTPWGTAVKKVIVEDGVTTIGYGAFYCCTDLTEVVIAETVETIGANAFEWCSSLEEITLPTGLQKLDSYAFTQCHGLKSIYIPESVSDIGTNPFLWCSSLESIAVDKANIYYFSQENCLIERETAVLISACEDSSIPQNAGIKEIGYNAFSSCNGITEIIIPEGVEKIDCYAFWCCENVSKVVIPKTVIEIDPLAFRSLNEQLTLTVADENEIYHSCENCIIETESKTLLFCNTNVIPGDKSVEVIGARAFEGSGMSAVYISENIKRIEMVAFNNYVKTVFFGGTRQQWEAIDIEAFGNAAILNASVHCGYTESSFAEQVCVYCPECDDYILESGERVKARVTFRDWDRAVLQTGTYYYGDAISAPAVPDRPSDNTYSYKFAGWGENASVICTGNAEYTATYIPTYIDYTVTFRNWDGSELSAGVYHYGDAVKVPTDPVRPADNSYSYIFSGWDEDVVSCIGNTTYTATYTAQPISYTVTFKNWDGTVLSSNVCHYGDDVITPATPTKMADTYYTYIFADWGEEVTSCTGDKEYTARFSKVSHSKVTINPSAEVLHRGDTFTVTADLSNAITINLGTVVLSFDDCVFELVGGTCHVENANPATVIPNQKVGTFMLNSTDAISGKLFTFAFRVKDDAVFGDYTIGSRASIGNGFGNDIDSNDSVLTVECKHEYSEWVRLDNTFQKRTCSICHKEETVYIEYTVTFQCDDGTVLSQKTYHYGNTVEIPQSPAAPAHWGGRYQFEGWDKEVSAVCEGDAVYVAIFLRLNPVGDIDDDMEVTTDDVVQLLLHVSMPDVFPISVEADFTGDGEVTTDDVIQLLLHVSMPDVFPLQVGKKEELPA